MTMKKMKKIEKKIENEIDEIWNIIVMNEIWNETKKTSFKINFEKKICWFEKICLIDLNWLIFC